MTEYFRLFLLSLYSLLTLLPGDIILTGTPAGVGVFRNPREFLKVTFLLMFLLFLIAVYLFYLTKILLMKINSNQKNV